MNVPIIFSLIFVALAMEYVHRTMAYCHSFETMIKNWHWPWKYTHIFRSLAHFQTNITYASFLADLISKRAYHLFEFCTFYKRKQKYTYIYAVHTVSVLNCLLQARQLWTCDERGDQYAKEAQYESTRCSVAQNSLICRGIGFSWSVLRTTYYWLSFTLCRSMLETC